MLFQRLRSVLSIFVAFFEYECFGHDDSELKAFAWSLQLFFFWCTKDAKDFIVVWCFQAFANMYQP